MPLGHGPGAACNSIKTQKRGGTKQGNFALLHSIFCKNDLTFATEM